MTAAEQKILAIFRRFRMGPYKMLCLNNFVNDDFLKAIEVLVANKLVVRDRPKHAYFLTEAGYTASMASVRQAGE